MHYICATYENHVTMMTRLNEYHTEFEKVLAIATVNGVPKNSLAAQEIADIATLLPDLRTAFTNMSDYVAVLDYAAWGLTAGDLDATLAAQGANLTALEVAVAASSVDIPTLSLDLKKKYVPFFKLLGAF